MRRISLLIACMVSGLVLTLSACDCGGGDPPKACTVPEILSENLTATMANAVAYTTTSFTVNVEFNLPVDLGASNVVAVSTTNSSVTLTPTQFETTDNIIWTFHLATLQPGTTYSVTFQDVVRSDCSSAAMDNDQKFLRVAACGTYDLGLQANSFKRYNTFSSTAGFSNEITSKQTDMNSTGTGTEVPVIELGNSAATCNQADLGLGMSVDVINNQCDWTPNGTSDAVVALVYERRGSQYSNPGVSEPAGDAQDIFLGGWVITLGTDVMPGNGATTTVDFGFPMIYKRSSGSPSCFPNEMIDLENVNPDANYGFSFFMWGYNNGYVNLSQDAGTDAANFAQKAMTLDGFKFVNSNARPTWIRTKNVYVDSGDDKARVGCALFNGMTDYDENEPGIDLLPYNMGSTGAGGGAGDDGTANETWDTDDNLSRFFTTMTGGMSTPISQTFRDNFRASTTTTTPAFLSTMVDYYLATPMSMSSDDQTSRWPDDTKGTTATTDDLIGIWSPLMNMLGAHYRKSYGAGSQAKTFSGTRAETDNNGDYVSRFMLVPGRNYYLRCSPMPEIMLNKGDKNGTVSSTGLTTANTLTYRLEISYNPGTDPVIPTAPTPITGAQVQRVLCDDGTVKNDNCGGATQTNYAIDGTSGVHQVDNHFSAKNGVHWYKITVN